MPGPISAGMGDDLRIGKAPQSEPSVQLSLAVPLWICTMNTGIGFCHC